MEKLLTIRQVSDILQVSPSLVYKWVHYNFVPYIKIGTLLRFKESDLISWIKRRSHVARKKYNFNVETGNPLT